MRGSAGNDGRGLGAVGASLLCVLTLAGCADAFVGMSMPSLPKIDDINPLAEKQVPLPGKRVSVIQQENITSNLAAGRQAHHCCRRRSRTTRGASPAASPATRRVTLRSPARPRAPGARTPAPAPASTAGSRPARSSTTTRSTRWMPPARSRHSASSGGAAGLARLDDAAQREGPGRVRRRAGRRRRPHLCRHRLRLPWWRFDARTGKQALGEERRIAGAHLADGRGRARVRGQQGRPGLLPLGLGRHGALELPRHARARQPALQRQPRRRWRRRRGALSER